MKTRYLLMVAIACMIPVSVAVYFSSYDDTPVTKENGFGINALVIHRPVSLGCPAADCHFPDYYLKINSASKTFITGYYICDGTSCTKKDGLLIPLPLVDVLHPDYRELPLPGDLTWEDGDFVNIKVKAPSTMIMGIDSSVPTVWIDLGKSEIVRSS